jgi:hypothetical protein
MGSLRFPGRILSSDKAIEADSISWTFSIAWTRRLTVIKTIETAIAVRTFCHPKGAESWTTPWNTARLEKAKMMMPKTMTVTSWVANPTIRTLTPMSFVFPCQLLDEAIPDPDT